MSAVKAAGGQEEEEDEDGDDGYLLYHRDLEKHIFSIILLHN